MTASPSIFAPSGPQGKSPGATPDFAAIAHSLGFPFLHRWADGTWAVPSDSTPGLAYQVDLEARTCACIHFARFGTCWHLDVAWVKAGGRMGYGDGKSAARDAA
jgi:hypothetical protein